MDIILATKNSHKAQEIKKVMGDSYNILTQLEAGINIDVTEDADTFSGNAVKKAAEIAKLIDLPVLADDSGLMVDYLSGRPGVYTARYAGESATDTQNIDKLLNELEGVPFGKRGAKFVCVLALAIPGQDIITFRGECEGFILTERAGDNGFGYDPVFYHYRYDISFAQMSEHIKNAVSHRGAALVKLKRYLNTHS